VASEPNRLVVFGVIATLMHELFAFFAVYQVPFVIKSGNILTILIFYFPFASDCSNGIEVNLGRQKNRMKNKCK
jgi:hypothetical protein